MAAPPPLPPPPLLPCSQRGPTPPPTPLPPAPPRHWRVSSAVLRAALHGTPLRSSVLYLTLGRYGGGNSPPPPFLLLPFLLPVFTLVFLRRLLYWDLGVVDLEEEGYDEQTSIKRKPRNLGAAPDIGVAAGCRRWPGLFGRAGSVSAGIQTVAGVARAPRGGAQQLVVLLFKLPLVFRGAGPLPGAWGRHALVLEGLLPAAPPFAVRYACPSFLSSVLQFHFPLLQRGIAQPESTLEEGIAIPFGCTIVASLELCPYGLTTIFKWWNAEVVLLLLFSRWNIKNWRHANGADDAILASSSHDEFLHCERLVSNWATSSNEHTVKEDKLALKDLFLRKLYTSDQECPRSYDKLRFDPSKSDCRLMVTHDDYSLMSKMAMQRTSVVTILRNPIDRVFSTYEFAVEVAARFLVHPNLTSATQMSMRIRPKSRGVSTLDIWPWKYLVPWMREDLFARRDARKLGKLSKIKDTSNPYNMEEIVMPLHMFIDDPVSHDIVHNGATFQVAGLTNNSCSAEAHEVHHCVRKHPVLGSYVLDVAKKRLDNMLYVGLTEEHKRSATMFANIIGAQVLSQSESLGSRVEKADATKSEIGSSLGDPDPDSSNPLQMTVETLMEAYEVCISGLRKSQSTRRTMSLKRIAPANFSKEARLLVPERVLQQIRSLNSLDLELYKHAQGLFAQQQKHLTESVENITAQSQKHLLEKLVRKANVFGNPHEYSQWKLFLIAVAVISSIALTYLAVRARRTTLKLKLARMRTQQSSRGPGFQTPRTPPTNPGPSRNPENSLKNHLEKGRAQPAVEF
ncbi:hypothetical protein Taro_028312 [Colocasia esculenta]|uniref:Protein-tyrosine sulfotransferase n=1 Tax=Colocasia esculenta TaxID=4460 RepID=A0A843VMR5_COLES|nr:hypothetical protein [Colocasia esculenta]